MNTAQPAKQKKAGIAGRTTAALFVMLFFVVICLTEFIRIYDRYIDRVLYAERLSQMKEVTSQLYVGLEDVVLAQWRETRIQSNSLLYQRPRTPDGLKKFMQAQTIISDLDSTQVDLLAIDSAGRYYTQGGLQGTMPEMDYLIDRPEEVSFVSNTLTTGETRMVFLERLKSPLVLTEGEKTTVISYYGISRSMEQLNPYFDCKAYNSHNSVYVVDDTGLKIFNSSSAELLPGANVYKVLSNMQYLHGGSYAQAIKDLATDGVAYSNAVLEGVEYYFSLYHMQNEEWTLVFLVPSDVVAINTVHMVNTTVQLVLIFSCVVAILFAVVIVFIMRRQQRRMLAVSEQNNAQLAAVNQKLDQQNDRLATAVKATEDALETAKSANSAKSDFLSSMSHDIRTPMNAILGITTLMENSLDDPEKLRMYLEKLRAAGEHLLGLINDVLDMSKIESGKTKLNVEKMNLAEQTDRVVELVRPQAQAHHHTFTVETENVTHENLYGDTTRVRQVLVNILSNAVKYTPDGGNIKFTIRECKRDGNYARYAFIVKDNGIGMDKEFQAHIFDSFSRAESTLTNRVQGTGLGMAITKSIVDLMGGTIELESAPGKGSTFVVTLDFKIDAENDAGQRKLDVAVINYSGKALNRIMDATSNVPVTVTSVATLDEAVAYVASHKPDVLLAPYTKGDPQRIDRVKRVRQAAVKPLIIIGMGEDSAEEAIESVRADGLDGYITTPFFMSTLVKEVERVRSKQSASDEETHTLQGLRFLCAEDNALNAEILEAMLTMAGATCTICGNGKEVYETFEAASPDAYDVILMDIQMPVMNGLEATKAIRSGPNLVGHTIPIIAMTANAFSDDIQRSMQAGMDAHLSKPIDMKLVEQTVREFVTRGGVAHHGTMVPKTWYN